MNESWLLTVGLTLGRVLVGGMLLLAGLLKFKAGSRWFLQQILAYELVKGKIAWLLAQGLPWSEICLGILLLVGFMTPLVVIMSFALLCGFTAAVVSTFWRSKPVDCGCFGRRINTQAHQTRWKIAYRNLAYGKSRAIFCKLLQIWVCCVWSCEKLSNRKWLDNANLIPDSNWTNGQCSS
jgi:uncharacterized membrane protein YphA (DoxX/SURF4 family)